jgi:hypothetical protein
MAYFEVLSHHSPGKNEETHEKLQWGKSVRSPSFEQGTLYTQVYSAIATLAFSGRAAEILSPTVEQKCS